MPLSWGWAESGLESESIPMMLMVSLGRRGLMDAHCACLSVLAGDCVTNQMPVIQGPLSRA